MRQFYQTLSGIHAIEVTYLSAVLMSVSLCNHQSSLNTNLHIFLTPQATNFFCEGFPVDDDSCTAVQMPTILAHTPPPVITWLLQVHPPRIYELLCLVLKPFHPQHHEFKTKENETTPRKTGERRLKQMYLRLVLLMQRVQILIHSFIHSLRVYSTHLRDDASNSRAHLREEATSRQVVHWGCSCACCSWLLFVCQILVRQVCSFDFSSSSRTGRHTTTNLL